MTRHDTRYRLGGAAILVVAVAAMAYVGSAIAKEAGIASPLSVLAQQGNGKSAAAAPGATTRPAGATSQPTRTTVPPGKTAAAAKPPAQKPVDTQAVRMSRPGTFEIHVQGADLRGVLQLLSTQGRKNIVATKEVAGTVTADLYGVNFKDALEAVLKAAGFVSREKDNFIYVYTPKQLEEVLKSERKLDTKVFRLAYVTAKDAKDMIDKVLSKEGTISTSPEAGKGVGASASDAGGNSNANTDVLIVTDYEDKIKEIEQIITDLDSKPDQVLLEVTILDADLTEKNALGVNFSTLAGIDFEGIASTSTALGDMSNAGMSGTKLKDAPASTFRTDFTKTPNGATVGFVTNNVAAFITALEEITDAVVLANPKMLIVNKQRGEILIGTSEGYNNTTITEGQTTQSVLFLDTGTRLIVRPFIGSDGYIRLEIHPEHSKGTSQSYQGIVMPSKQTTEMTTNVLVRDGHTIVMGGLFREETTNARNQIPILGNLPYVGAAFRYTKDTTIRKEIIILLTPHIIKHSADEAVSEQLKDDVQRFRIGQRKGVQWFGRDRLAQTHMSWARQAISEDKPDKAMWNIDMALSLSPRMEEAVRLKERLSGKAYWSDYSQDSSALFIVQRMIMQDLGRPVERIIPHDKPRDASAVEPVVRDTFGITQRYEDPLTPSGAATQPTVTREILLHAPQPVEKSKTPTTGPSDAGGKTQ